MTNRSTVRGHRQQSIAAATGVKERNKGTTKMNCWKCSSQLTGSGRSSGRQPVVFGRKDANEVSIKGGFIAGAAT